MRGILIQRPLEYRLDVIGDSFEQGASVPCSLTIKNHAQTPTKIEGLSLLLATGNLKKVKSRDSDAFEILERFELASSLELAPSSHVTHERVLHLSLNSAITDKNSSPYLLYGDSAHAQGIGQLLLTTQPHAHVRHIFDTMTTVFNFINRGVTSKDNQTVAKFKSPDSRRYSLVEELNVFSSFGEDLSITLRFVFTVKRFDHSSTAVAVKKAKVEILRQLEPSEYLFGGSFVRQEYIDEQIEAALAEVSSGL